MGKEVTIWQHEHEGDCDGGGCCLLDHCDGQGWYWMDASGSSVGPFASADAAVHDARMAAVEQPIFNSCRNCGTADHLDYNCPCGCHEEGLPGYLGGESCSEYINDRNS